jgi:hypothetical protein
MTDEPHRADASDAPPRPKDESGPELEFERRPRMVRWLSPTQLFHTGRQALFAVLISGYTDKREIQAALPSPGIVDRSGNDAIWIDFVSDLGDGFNPTFALASLLAKPSLDLPDPTPRGSILVMGGDQAYPAASQKRYRNKLVGPFRAALPYLAEDEPELFVVPGNHDWFDGLTSFMRAFCQRGWVGAWRTQQTRSYFAVKLPHHWWLWGVDIQFDNYVDWPQLEYFLEVAEDVQKGDGVIVCLAKPSWVDANAAEPILDPDVYATFDYLERKAIIARGATIPLAISGDRHHYARYEERSGARRQRITCGGGGAFLSDTHGLPDPIVVPHPEASRRSPSPPSTYSLEKRYPEKRDSIRQAWFHVWSLLWRNDLFPVLVGAVAFFFALLGRGAITRGEQSLWAMPDHWWRRLLTCLIAGLLLLALVGFTKHTRLLRAWGLGLLHTVMHLAGIAVTAWAASRLVHAWWPDASRDVHVGLTLGGTFVLYGIVGCEIFALYLLIADRFRMNRTELFAAMRVQDRKSFLRMRIDAEGCTVHPVKVEKVPRSWQLKPTGEASDPWFTPVGGDPVPELIEPPILVPREG